MSRQLEAAQEARVDKRNNQLVRALEYELSGVLEIQRMTLLGFSLKIESYECLMTLRVVSGDSYMVGFVGSDTAANCIVKAVSAVRNGKVPFQADKYR